MTVLPIVQRELRVASRRKGTYWNRALSAGVAILVFGLMFLVGASEPSRALGKNLFTVLSVCFLGVSLLTGVIYTADSVSEEKREGTLGLLFLTDLRGYDVVVGKLTASSLGAVYATLSILPVLAIPLLLGGVSVGEFGRVVLVLINTMFLSLAAGVMVSAVMRHALASMAVTLGLVLAVNLVPPLLGVWIGYVTHTQPPEPLLVPSVGYACAVAHEPLFSGRERGFATSVGVSHGLAWMFLVLASQRTRRVWQESVTTTGESWSERLGRWMRGDPKVQQRWRHAALEVNPCYWSGGRLWYKGWIVWVGLGVVGLLWMAGYAEWGSDWSDDEGVALLSVLGLHTLLRWWLAGEAVMGLGPEKRSGALELLLCTGLSVRELLRGKAMVLQRQFLAPALAVAAFDVVMLGVVLGEAGAGDEALWWLSCFGCLIVVFLLDMVALTWLGLWWGVVCRQASRALLRAAALVFALPWALLIGLLVLLVAFRVNVPEPQWAVFLGTYGVVCGTISVLSAQWARQRLMVDLRTTIAVGRRSAERLEAPQVQPSIRA